MVSNNFLCVTLERSDTKPLIWWYFFQSPLPNGSLSLLYDAVWRVKTTIIVIKKRKVKNK